MDKDLEKQLADTVKAANAAIAQKQEAIDAKLDLMATSVEKGEEFKNEIKGEVAKLINEHKALSEQADALATEMKRNVASVAPKDRTFKGELIGGLRKSMEQYKSYKSRGASDFAFMIDEAKAVTEAGNLTDEVIEADYVPGIVYDPERTERVRNYVSQGVTSSDQVVYNQETSYTDNTRNDC